MNWSDYLGWLGCGIMIISYVAVTIRRISVRSLLYQSLCVIGSIFLGLNSFIHKAFIPTIFNGVWGSLALYTLIVFLIKRKNGCHPREGGDPGK
jgi:hypothetical protein